MNAKMTNNKNTNLINKNTPEKRNLWITGELWCSIMQAVCPFHCYLLQSKCLTQVLV